MAAKAVQPAQPSAPPAAQAANVYRECPFCREQLRRDASVCPHCRRESPAWTLHEGQRWTNVDGVWYRLDETSNSWVRSETQATEAGPAPG
jgi:predicted amidophosphoribosyltransferase